MSRGDLCKTLSCAHNLLGFGSVLSEDTGWSYFQRPFILLSTPIIPGRCLIDGSIDVGVFHILLPN